ncbi:ATP-binding protein [Candidatus Dojkabacteria bacterium]|nr:ATP-binding protein [Candidatus Dojkabacteria bacterium]
MVIKRAIEKEIVEHLSSPEITLIVGPRQVGKTTLINKIAESLKNKGESVFTLNLDIEDDFGLLESQSRLVSQIGLNIGKDKGYVFIDEVQRKEDAGRFFKGIYDMKLPYKFILTGSGSVELKEKVSESLTGRKKIFEMRPISFFEFIDYKTQYQYSDRLASFFSLKDPRLEPLFNEYMQFGGYPRVMLADRLETKRAEMQEIYKSYLEKDITQLLNIQKAESFSKLITLLSSQAGKQINIEELSTTLSLDSKTIKNYLWYLEKTYIIKVCRPYFTNPRSELVKSSVYYFLDLGMSNYALNRFSNFDLTLHGGQLFENFIFNHLINKYYKTDPTINFWRTKDGAEVDFIFRVGAQVIPIEVKYKKLLKPTAGRSLYNYLEKYKSAEAHIVNLTLDEEIKSRKSKLIFSSYPKFLSMDI